MIMDELGSLHSNVFAQSLFPLLKENQGVVVHYGNHGYIVAKIFDDEEGEFFIKMIEDDDVLSYSNLQLLQLHDEPVGNA